MCPPCLPQVGLRVDSGLSGRYAWGMTAATGQNGTFWLVLACVVGALAGCGSTGKSGSEPGDSVSILSPVEARELIEGEDDLFVLSVCHKWEFDYYRISGSAMVPHHLLADWLGGAELYPQINQGRRPRKDQPVLLYCSTGGRTRKASEQMARLGYEKVYVLGGGMRDWMRAGIPYDKTTLVEEDR